MKTVLASNDIVFMAHVRAVLDGEGIGSVLLDETMASLYGGIDAIQTRLCVLDEDEAEALALIGELRRQAGGG